MYRFTHVLIIVCIVTVGSSSVWAESDESEAAAEKTRIPGWFRVDTDTLGTHFLIGATHSVGGISLDSNIYINIPSESLTLVFPSPLLRVTVSVS